MKSTTRSAPLLVTGPTGSVGRSLVSQLLAAGARVRALARKPASANLPAEVEVFQGDLASGELEPGALDGVRQVFVFPAQPGVGSFCALLAKAGVEHAVVLSSLAAALEHARDRDSSTATHHLAVERDVRASGIAEVTVLRPGTFANNLLAWSRPIRAGTPVELAWPGSAQAPIHEADIAAVAAAVLLSPTHRGETLPMTGPESLTRVAQLAAIGRAIGRPLAHREVSPAHFAASSAAFIPAAIVELLLAYWSDTARVPDVVRPTVAEVTGRPARSLEEWTRGHASAFV